jgi:acid phosphatase
MVSRRRSLVAAVSASGRLAAVSVLSAAALAACGSGSGSPGVSTPAHPTSHSRPATSSVPPTAAATSAAASSAPVPTPAHVVVVVMENRSYADIVGNASAPFLNAMAAQGARFTQSFAVTHPSEPNYLALFSGSTQGVTSDSCPHTFSTPNLGASLLAKGLTFAGFSEGLPATGDLTCNAGAYARKHNPWSDFSNVPASANRPFRDFPSDYTRLPTVSFVIPDLDHDMHDGSIATGDRWLHDNLDGYLTWARAHDSLLVVTWDENDGGAGNQILTIIAGSGVRAGAYPERVDHYRLLRTVEDAFGLPPAGASAQAAPITDIWSGGR